MFFYTLEYALRETKVSRVGSAPTFPDGRFVADFMTQVILEAHAGAALFVGQRAAPGGSIRAKDRRAPAIGSGRLS